MNNFTEEEDFVEEWRPMELFEEFLGTYEISNIGRVRTVKTGNIRTGRSSRGYLTISISNRGVCKKVLIHRMVAFAFCENKDPSKFTIVNHIDGNKGNSKYTNLEWCDHKMNTRHAMDVLKVCGAKKISDEDVEWARENMEFFPIRAIAKKFSVDAKTLRVRLGIDSPTEPILSKREGYVKFTEQEIETIRKYLSDGASCSEIAESIGCTIRTILDIKDGKTYIKKHSFQKYRLPEEDVKEIRKCFITNHREFGATALAKKFKVPYAEIQAIVRDFKVEKDEEALGGIRCLTNSECLEICKVEKIDKTNIYEIADRYKVSVATIKKVMSVYQYNQAKT